MQARNFAATAPLRDSAHRTAEPRARTRGQAAAGAQTAPKAAVWGFTAVLLLIAYEWLVSGMDKLISGDFRGGLAAQLQDAAKTNPRHWYAHFLTSFAIPHAATLGLLVECGEIAVGLGILVSAVRWAGADHISLKWISRFDLVAIGAFIGAGFMTANFALMMGDSLPWISTADPFDEGIHIDTLLTLVAIAMVVVHAYAWRADRRRAAEAELAG